MAGPRTVVITLVLAAGVAGCSAKPADTGDALLPAKAAVAQPHQWEFAGTTMAPPAGWSLVKEIHDPVPTAGGPPFTSHTVGYSADAANPMSPMIELNVMAGDAGPPTTLEQMQLSEAAPRWWDTDRPQKVILAREEGEGDGLTIVMWDETPDLRVSVIGRHGTTLAMVRAAVESVVIATE